MEHGVEAATVLRELSLDFPLTFHIDAISRYLTQDWRHRRERKTPLKPPSIGAQGRFLSARERIRTSTP